MYNRNQLFEIFVKEFPGTSIAILRRVFIKMSDDELAKAMGFKVLRRGFFVR